MPICWAVIPMGAIRRFYIIFHDFTIFADFYDTCNIGKNMKNGEKNKKNIKKTLKKKILVKMCKNPAFFGKFCFASKNMKMPLYAYLRLNAG